MAVSVVLEIGCAVDVQFVYEYLSTSDSNWLLVDHADVAPQHLMCYRFDHYYSYLIASLMMTMMMKPMMSLYSVQPGLENEMHFTKKSQADCN